MGEAAFENSGVQAAPQTSQPGSLGAGPSSGVI